MSESSWDLGQACPACRQVRKDQVNCRYCVGTGYLKYVGWATSSWSEVIPNLWVGGHEYQDHPAYTTRVLVDELAEAGFDVVASLVDMDCPPPDGTVHLELLVVDDTVKGLYVDEIEQAYEMALVVAEHVQAGRKTLVRCHAGLNRSSLVAALAMVKMGYEPSETIDLIREKRSHFALFNQRFVEIIMAQRASQESTP